MGDFTAANSAENYSAREQLGGLHPVLPSLSYNVVTICSTFLAQHDTSAQIEHVGVAERSELRRPLGAGAGSRHHWTISRHATAPGAV
jgi:hypothetical protein